MTKLPRPYICIALFLIAIIPKAASHEENSHNCKHDVRQYRPKATDFLPDENPQGRLLQSYSNIRIVFDSTALETIDSTQKDYILNNLIAPSERYFEAALKVIPYSAKLRSPYNMICDDVPVPPLYQSSGAGVNGDLLIIITTTNEPSSSYLASAGACLFSTANNRPVFGTVNFNLAYITATTNEVQIKKDIKTTLHEITHILGFSSFLYEMFVNPTTNEELTGHVLTRTVNGQSISVLNVSPLTSRLRTYFNCPTLEGAYLENEGGAGSAGSHFERRVFGNEYMTASDIADDRISEFTFALLQGSGWYQVDYSMTEPLTYGKGAGCSFLDSTCLDGSGAAAFAEFCDVDMQVGCSQTRRGISYCPYQASMRDSYADNCPITRVYVDGDCEDEDNQDASTPEFYGNGGKCFTGTIDLGLGRSAFCLKQTCEAKVGGGYNVKVQIGSTTATCTSAGNIAVTGYTGTLTCPDPNTFCSAMFCSGDCFGRGTCVQGQCQCADGWGGHDCTKKEYEDNCSRCASSDPFKTSCYGDSCECNPSDLSCRCHLGLATGAQCATYCGDGWNPSDCSQKAYKYECTRCAGSTLTPHCYGDICAPRSVDGGSEPNSSGKKDTNGALIGIIVGAAVGGAVLIGGSIGVYFMMRRRRMMKVQRVNQTSRTDFSTTTTRIQA